MRCRLDNDKWNDIGVIWYVHTMKTREDSTAVELTLEDDHGNIHTRVVSRNQIEWIDE